MYCFQSKLIRNQKCVAHCDGQRLTIRLHCLRVYRSVTVETSLLAPGNVSAITPHVH